MGIARPVVAGVASTAPSILLLLLLLLWLFGWERLGVKEAVNGVVGTTVVTVVVDEGEVAAEVAAVNIDRVLTGDAVVGLPGGGTTWIFGDTEMCCAADAVALTQSDGKGGGRVSAVLLLLSVEPEPFFGLPVLWLLPLPNAMLLALLCRW